VYEKPFLPRIEKKVFDDTLFSTDYSRFGSSVCDSKVCWVGQQPYRSSCCDVECTVVREKEQWLCNEAGYGCGAA
jgi:hypothetical protein